MRIFCSQLKYDIPYCVFYILMCRINLHISATLRRKSWIRGGRASPAPTPSNNQIIAATPITFLLSAVSMNVNLPSITYSYGELLRNVDVIVPGSEVKRDAPTPTGNAMTAYSAGIDRAAFAYLEKDAKKKNALRGSALTGFAKAQLDAQMATTTLQRAGAENIAAKEETKSFFK